MISEVYRSILSASFQRIASNIPVIGKNFILQQENEPNTLPTQQLWAISEKKEEVSDWPSKSDHNPIDLTSWREDCREK